VKNRVDSSSWAYVRWTFCSFLTHSTICNHFFRELEATRRFEKHRRTIIDRSWYWPLNTLIKSFEIFLMTPTNLSCCIVNNNGSLSVFTPGVVNRYTDNRYESITTEVNRRLISIASGNQRKKLLSSIINYGLPIVNNHSTSTCR